MYGNLGFSTVPKGFICSYIGPLGIPLGAQKVWKWVGDACPVDMGQLDHCVVLGTKSGAVQDFQWGKQCQNIPGSASTFFLPLLQGV